MTLKGYYRMTPIELFTLAIAGLNANLPGVTLVFPSGKLPRGFPRGELLIEHPDGERVYSVHPEKLLHYLIKNRAVKMVSREGNLFEFEIVGNG